ncbi:hypothetical protein [Actinophytocola glycyrrhizae]|uniref:CcmD family protein n=1 Tax=Actinophytocola glycyrrhizae TaxID=2044873 RepID=A0ABV9SEQ3_9PSEU
MAVVEHVLIGIGLVCWAVLLVIGAVALVRDWLSERVKRQKAIAAVQRELASRHARLSAPTSHGLPPLGGRHAA